MQGEAAPRVSDVLLEAASQRERSRAIAVAAAVRLGGASTFLLLTLALRTRGRPEWAIYMPMLTVYALLALGLFLLRHRPVSPRIGWLMGLMDVGLVYLMQREALPLSASPASVACFTLGPFAALIALSALTMRTLAIVFAAAAAAVAEVLLMRQARLPIGTMVSAVVILTVMAVVGQAVLPRLRLLGLDLSQADAQRPPPP